MAPYVLALALAGMPSAVLKDHQLTRSAFRFSVSVETHANANVSVSRYTKTRYSLSAMDENERKAWHAAALRERRRQATTPEARVRLDPIEEPLSTFHGPQSSNNEGKTQSTTQHDIRVMNNKTHCI